MNNDIILKIKNLKKAYSPDNLILKGINLDIKKGDFVGIIGLSGAGKSTFLRCINRLIEPTEGEILIPASILDPPLNFPYISSPLKGEDKGEGDNMIDIIKLEGKELRYIRRKIGMIFQQFNIVKRLTVLDNVLSGGLGYKPVFKSTLRLFSLEDKKLALVNLERVGLLKYAYRMAGSLSGGEQQRVAIARTLQQKPAIILADEPVASLDPKLSKIVLDILQKVCKEDDITTLVSLHTLEITKAYADRIIGFAKGEVAFDGIAQELTKEIVENVYALYRQ